MERYQRRQSFVRLRVEFEVEQGQSWKWRPSTFPAAAVTVSNYQMSNISNISNTQYQISNCKLKSKVPLLLMKYSDACNQMHFPYFQSTSALSMELPNNSCFSSVNFADEYTELSSQQIWIMNEKESPKVPHYGQFTQAGFQVPNQEGHVYYIHQHKPDHDAKFLR